MNRIILLILAVVFSGSTYAQAAKDTMAPKENIKVVSRFRNGAVELRWYPTSAASWRKANRFGYSIKRMELSDAGSAAGFKELAVVKQFTPDEWKQKLNTRDTLVRAAMESMQPLTPVKGQGFVDAQNEEGSMFFSYIISTSFSADAAKGAGLMYNDNTILSGTKYAYSVSINSTKDKESNDEVLVFVTDTRSEYLAPSPEDVTFEEEESAVKLIWNNTTNKELFTAYFIERSADAGKTFSTLNKVPFISVAENTVEFYYTDSVKNYVPYQYRITGLTPWVDKSNPSVVIKAMGRDRTPASPPMNTRAKGDRSKIIVTWELPVSSSDLQGFKIARSNKIEGPFSSISGDKTVAKTARTFTDERPTPKEPYYVVYAVDTAGNYNSTFSVMASIYDSVAPAQPVGLTGSIDTNGLVKLSWKTGTDNDLVGYHVYVANGKDNVYRQLTGYPVSDSSFTDTVSMRSLTRDVFYKITAIDYNNNASAYSTIANLKRPDVIAPAAPVISNYSVENNKVILTMTGSSSNDVVSYRLIRTGADGRENKLVEGKEIKSFTDSDVKEGDAYTYTIVATDASNLSTSSKPLQVTVQEQEIKPGISSLTARTNDKEQQVLLSWNVLSGQQPSSLVLFRAADGEELLLYKKLSPDKQSYMDNTAPGKYQYAIKVLYSNGAESELSAIAAAEIRN